jgi:D-cysteine desulfhydrase
MERLGGPEIYFKRDDLTGCALSGNKIRKLEFSIAEAIRDKANVIITAGGIQSNHCRATSIVCASLGLDCHLILRGKQEGPPDGNLLLDKLTGAKFSFFPQEMYSTGKPEIVAQLSEEYARAGKRAYWIPVGASNAIGTCGYVKAWNEIGRQCSRMGLLPDHIIVPLGSGGTQAGLIVGRALSRTSKPKIWGVNVCDDAATFRHDIGLILEEMRSKFNLKLSPASVPINILDGYVGDGYAIPFDDEMRLIQELARTTGQILDPVYTGKAFYGLMQEIMKGQFRKNEKILFIHTGGIFGLFPQKNLFM